MFSECKQITEKKQKWLLSQIVLKISTNMSSWETTGITLFGKVKNVDNTSVFYFYVFRLT